jgi:hypothetical protein
MRRNLLNLRERSRFGPRRSLATGWACCFGVCPDANCRQETVRIVRLVLRRLAVEKPTTDFSSLLSTQPVPQLCFRNAGVAQVRICRVHAELPSPV